VISKAFCNDAEQGMANKGRNSLMAGWALASFQKPEKFRSGDQSGNQKTITSGMARLGVFEMDSI